MADITSNLDAALQKHEAHLKHSRRKRSQTADEFLKEAYRLVCLHFGSLIRSWANFKTIRKETSPPVN